MVMVLLTAINLRGIRESGTFFAIPTYLFMFAILGMCAYGFLGWRSARSRWPGSRSWTSRRGWEEPITTLGLVILLARAFSSGCWR